jgi:serine/threonine-protein kinase HipA
MTPTLDIAFAFSPSEDIQVGRLALDGNSAVFEYDNAFSNSGLSLNPRFGAIEPGLIRPSNPRAFEGIHGVFADSLPDAWGRLLLERTLRQSGVRIESLTILERLAYVGKRGRGALTFQPSAPIESEDRAVDLDLLAGEAGEVIEGDPSDVLAELARLGGSSGGARPKVQVALDDGGHARSDEIDSPPGFTSWIVKFPSSIDRFPDIGPLEAAYAEAARRAGIDMPRTRLVPAKRGPAYFATERFDRSPKQNRIHMISIAGMLDADWTIPSIDYDNVLDAIRAATRDERDVGQMYRRMVFNVLASNRDDHAKQHALLMARDGRWRLSPAYDLTLASGPGNEHYLAVNGRGKNITRLDLLAVAGRQSIARQKANGLIDEVASVVATLPSIAADFGVSRATLAELAQATAGRLKAL